MDGYKKRDEELLAKRFPMEKSLLVYPVSSRNLMQASDRKYSNTIRGYALEDSFFPVFREALDKLILKTVELVNVSSALTMINQYHAEGGEWLECQKTMLSATSRKEKAAIQEKHTQLMVAYKNECGEHGTKRKKALDQISQMVNIIQTSMRTITTSDGAIQNRFITMINNQNDFNSLNNLYLNMNYLVNEEISQEWNRIIDEIMDKAAKLFAEFNVSVYTSYIPYADVNAVSLEEREISRQVSVPYEEQVSRMVPVTKRIMKRKAVGYSNTAVGMSGGAAIGAMIGSIIPGFGTFLGALIGGGIGSAIGSSDDEKDSVVYEDVVVNEEKWETVTKYCNETIYEKEGLDRNRIIVLNYFRECMRAYQELFYGNGDSKSPIQNLCEQIKTQIQESLELQYNSIENRLSQEKEELERQSQIGEDKRKSELAILEKQIEEWNLLQTSILTIAKTVRDLENKLK